MGQRIHNIRVGLFFFLFMFTAFYGVIMADEAKIVEEIRSVYKAARILELDTASTSIKVMRVFRGDSLGSWVAYKPESTAYSVGVAYLADHRISSAAFTESSPSGDWATDTNYYYRENGSLAFIFSSLRTFNGNIKVESRAYFDSSGIEVRQEESVFDLFTGEPLNDNSPGYGKNSFHTYMTAAELLDSLGQSIYGKEHFGPDEDNKAPEAEQ